MFIERYLIENTLEDLEDAAQLVEEGQLEVEEYLMSASWFDMATTRSLVSQLNDLCVDDEEQLEEFAEYVRDFAENVAGCGTEHTFMGLEVA